MRAVIQRVSSASVSVQNRAVASIEKGLLVLVGIEYEDNEEDIKWLSKKIVNLRIFNDDKGIMNCSVIEHGGGILLVSQFTLHASTKKGNRPSYLKAGKSDYAIPIYEKMTLQLEADSGCKIQTGIFGADMQVSLVNTGPVTIYIDTKNRE